MTKQKDSAEEATGFVAIRIAHRRCFRIEYDV